MRYKNFAAHLRPPFLSMFTGVHPRLRDVSDAISIWTGRWGCEACKSGCGVFPANPLVTPANTIVILAKAGMTGDYSKLNRYEITKSQIIAAKRFGKIKVDITGTLCKVGMQGGKMSFAPATIDPVNPKAWLVGSFCNRRIQKTFDPLIPTCADDVQPDSRGRGDLSSRVSPGALF